MALRTITAVLFFALLVNKTEAASFDDQMEFLRTVCVSGQKVDYKVDLSGGLTMLLRGAKGSASFSKESAQGINRALSGDHLAADLKSQRECMSKFGTRISDALTAAAVPEKRVDVKPATPSAGPQTRAVKANEDFFIPDAADRLFAFSQAIGPNGEVEGSIEWPSMSRTEFPLRIDNLIAYSRRQKLKLVITARTKNNNWGMADSITYRKESLPTQAYFNPGVKTVHDGKEVRY